MTNGREPVFDGPLEEVVDFMADNGFWIVGSPEDCIDGIRKLDEESGGFGAFMVQTIDWASRQNILHSFELIARYVMPQFQGTVISTAASRQWAEDRKTTLVKGRTAAIDRAHATYAENQSSN